LSQAESSSLALGGILGAGLFLNCIVVGTIGLIGRGKVALNGHAVIRDIGFYLLGLMVLSILVLTHTISPWEGVLLLAIYISYVAVTLSMAHGYGKCNSLMRIRMYFRQLWQRFRTFRSRSQTQEDGSSQVQTIPVNLLTIPSITIQRPSICSTHSDTESLGKSSSISSSSKDRSSQSSIEKHTAPYLQPDFNLSSVSVGDKLDIEIPICRSPSPVASFRSLSPTERSEQICENIIHLNFHSMPNTMSLASALELWDAWNVLQSPLESGSPISEQIYAPDNHSLEEQRSPSVPIITIETPPNPSRAPSRGISVEDESQVNGQYLELPPNLQLPRHSSNLSNRSSRSVIFVQVDGRQSDLVVADTPNATLSQFELSDRYSTIYFTFFKNFSLLKQLRKFNIRCTTCFRCASAASAVLEGLEGKDDARIQLTTTHPSLISWINDALDSIYAHHLFPLFKTWPILGWMGRIIGILNFLPVFLFSLTVPVVAVYDEEQSDELIVVSASASQRGRQDSVAMLERIIAGEEQESDGMAFLEDNGNGTAIDKVELMKSRSRSLSPKRSSGRNQLRHRSVSPKRSQSETKMLEIDDGIPLSNLPISHENEKSEDSEKVAKASCPFGKCAWVPWRHRWINVFHVFISPFFVSFAVQGKLNYLAMTQC
jgi:Ca2+/Na+ antiporter